MKVLSSLTHRIEIPRDIFMLIFVLPHFPPLQSTITPSPTQLSLYSEDIKFYFYGVDGGVG